MKKIVLSVMAVVLSRGSGGVAARTIHDSVPEPVTPAAGAVDGKARATDGLAERPGCAIHPENVSAFRTAEPPCHVRAPQDTVH